MNISPKPNTKKTKKFRGDVVKKLIDFELDKNVRIVVPEFPHDKGFYEAKDYFIEGFPTKATLLHIKAHKEKFIHASKLRWIRDHQIFEQTGLEIMSEEILIYEDTEEYNEMDFDLRMQSWEKKEYKRYFEFKDHYCIRNHTETKRCFETLFPCRSCLINSEGSDNKTFPLISHTTTRLLRIV